MLLIFCLVTVSATEKEVLNAPRIIMNLSISLCNSVRFCLMHFEGLLLGAPTLRICLLGELTPYRYMLSLFTAGNIPYSEVYFTIIPAFF